MRRFWFWEGRAPLASAGAAPTAARAAHRSPLSAPLASLRYRGQPQCPPAGLRWEFGNGLWAFAPFFFQCRCWQPQADHSCAAYGTPLDKQQFLENAAAPQKTFIVLEFRLLDLYDMFTVLTSVSLTPNLIASFSWLPLSFFPRCSS